MKKLTGVTDSTGAGLQIGRLHQIADVRARVDSMEPGVVDNEQDRRYELWLGERLAGFVTYSRSDGVVSLNHAEVEPELRNQGHGETLVRETIALVRREGAKVRPLCPFVVAYVRRHPDVQDVVA